MPGLQQRRARRERERSRAPTQIVGALGYGPELTDWLCDWALGRSFASSLIRKAHSKFRGGCTDPIITRLAKCHANLANAERMVESLMPLSSFPQMRRVENSEVADVILPL